MLSQIIALSNHSIQTKLPRSNHESNVSLPKKRTPEKRKYNLKSNNLSATNHRDQMIQIKHIQNPKIPENPTLSKSYWRRRNSRWKSVSRIGKAGSRSESEIEVFVDVGCCREPIRGGWAAFFIPPSCMWRKDFVWDQKKKKTGHKM